MHSIVIIVGH